MHGASPLLFTMLLVVAKATMVEAETLEEYAQKCDAAVGVTVPDFECDAGTLVPVTNFLNGSCDRPNRLNKVCDPGSRDQVLALTDTAYVIAHCRKQGKAAGFYGDIAVIQTNRKTGATCWYQALGTLSGSVKAPSKGKSAYDWHSPADTAAIECARCHDNGAIIRSPYLTQVTGPNALLGRGDNQFNRNQPYYFIGEDFASWKAFEVEIAGNRCNDCHRMGTSNLTEPCRDEHNMPTECGTGLFFGIRATARSEAAKNTHSPASPIWMTPGQIYFNEANAAAAEAIRACALRKFENPLPNSDSCRIRQFTGRESIHVDPMFNCPIACDGSPENPYDDLPQAISAVREGGILMLRPGTYGVVSDQMLRKTVEFRRWGDTGTVRLVRG